MLHLGVADCVGQYPVVRTLTVRSTPPSDTFNSKQTSSGSRFSVKSDIIMTTGAITSLGTDKLDQELLRILYIN